MQSVDKLGERLVGSGLMTAEELSARRQTWQALGGAGADDGNAFATWLIGQNVLTDFQAEAILAGHAGPFNLGPYEVREYVAAGRLGHVYQAVHKQFDQPVSLKVFPATLVDQPQAMARMQRELRVAVQLDHPHLTRTFHVGRVGPVFYLAFERLEGESLAARLKREGRLAYPEACRLLRQAALALEYLHKSEIVHGDFQPANLWITSGGQLKLMEFGAARDSLEFLDIPDDRSADVLADDGAADWSPYRAPEVAAGKRPDARSDIYSLGCTLYEAVTGQSPFPETDPGESAVAHATRVPQLASFVTPTLPDRLSEILAVAMAKDPARRYQTAGEVDWELNPLVGEGLVGVEADETNWSPDFLAWTQSAGLAVEPTEGAVIDPEFNDFLVWLVDKPTGVPAPTTSPSKWERVI